MKTFLKRLSNPKVYGVCGEGGLEIGKDSVPKMIVSNCLKSIVSKPITYKNSFPMQNRALLSESQLKYV